MRPLKPRFFWPRARSESRVLRAARRLWTLPTDGVGTLVAWLIAHPQPLDVQGPASRARLFRVRRPFESMGAIALGHVILYSEPFVEARGRRAVFVHEMAHGRQSDWLGPAYLPAHIVCQLFSALCVLLRRKPARYSPVHDYNPLEQSLICFGVGCIDALSAGELLDATEEKRLYAAFGLTDISEQTPQS